jgi:hypothetical protein
MRVLLVAAALPGSVIAANAQVADSNSPNGQLQDNSSNPLGLDANDTHLHARKSDTSSDTTAFDRFKDANTSSNRGAGHQIN